MFNWREPKKKGFLFEPLVHKSLEISCYIWDNARSES